MDKYVDKYEKRILNDIKFYEAELIYVKKYTTSGFDYKKLEKALFDVVHALKKLDNIK